MTLAAAVVLLATSAGAAEYLDTVQSSIFEAPFDHKVLSRRAAICLSQNAGISGQTMQTDIDGGTVVGASLFSYSSGGIPWSVKSTLTFEAKDGRFRLTHSNLAQKQGGPAIPESWSILSGSVNQSAEGGWIRVGKWSFSGYKKVEGAAQAMSQRIATCVQSLHSDW